MADDILRKDIESLLDSWYNAGAPQRSEDLQARHRPGEKVKPAEHDAQLSTNLAHIKTIGDIILPASQWSHSLQQLETNDADLVLYRAEFAQPTRQHPVPLVTASVYISCSRRENTVSTQKRRVWIRFEEQDYRWRLDGSVTDDGKVQWTGMGGVNPMKWLTELIRSKSQLPFDLATVSSTVVAV